MIKSDPLTKRQRHFSQKENRISLPFMQKYKDKITRISKDGSIRSNNINELPSLYHSKAVSKELLEKQNQSEMMNLRTLKKKQSIKIQKERTEATETNENAMCIKLDPSDFQNMMKTLELPPLSKKAKGVANCRYMMIVMKE